MISEFREFAIKGNMIDMAVGIIMGAAFGTVVNSLVNDVIMPPIGMALGGVDFSNIGIALGTNPKGEAVTIAIGSFINNVISFLIVAWAVFMLVKAVNTAKKMAEKKKPAEVAAAAAPTRSEVLLEEIRNALVSKK
ncbi:MAG: large-conductance mechanosensitive channel protein MscL [Hyphomicrobiaceae bacterium]